jgi:PilZ domain-containing protein
MFMGAAPKFTGQRGAVSPLREVAYRPQIANVIPIKPGPQRFTRVPTHAIGVVQERRGNPRAALSLPLRLIRVGDMEEPIPVTLVTRNISSSGVFFLAPRDFELGTAIELEVALVDRPLGYGRVQMCTAAHIVRAEDTEMPGWRGYAATFDDFALQRDDVLPTRYRAR